MIAIVSPRRASPRIAFSKGVELVAPGILALFFEPAAQFLASYQLVAGGRLTYVTRSSHPMYAEYAKCLPLKPFVSSARPPTLTRVSKFRKYPLSVSFIRDLFIVPISMCKSLNFKNKRTKKEKPPKNATATSASAHTSCPGQSSAAL